MENILLQPENPWQTAGIIAMITNAEASTCPIRSRMLPFLETLEITGSLFSITVTVHIHVYPACKRIPQCL